MNRSNIERFARYELLGELKEIKPKSVKLYFYKLRLNILDKEDIKKYLFN